MKKFDIKKTILFLALCLQGKTQIAADKTQAAPQSTNSSASSTTESFQGLLDSIVSYPAVSIDATTQKMQQVPINRVSRYVLPSSSVLTAQQSNFSVLRPQDTKAYKDYPSGASLFPKNSDVAQQFDTVFSQIKTNKELIKLLRKFHFNCLNQLYAYLMKVHTNLIISHVGTSYDATGKIIFDAQSFIDDNTACQTNKKTLITSFLINLIESQFHASTLACIPALPYLFATPIGKISIQNDYSIDLTMLVMPATNDSIKQIQTNYCNFLQQYLQFFTLYTNLLNTTDQSTGYTQFVTVAQDLEKNPLVAKMNPAMFFYDQETLRSVKMIPFLASELPAKTTPIGWAQDAITAAKNNTLIDKFPVGILQDASNAIIHDETTAAHLSICSASGDNIFQEELLKEPVWLNSLQGIINITKACLGDFSTIKNLAILDPITQGILEKITTSGVISQQTQQAINTLVQALTPTPDTTENTPPVAAKNNPVTSEKPVAS